MVVAEAKYPLSCYRGAMVELKKLNKIVMDDDSAVDDVHSKAISDSVSHVKKNFHKSSFTSMIDFTSFYKSSRRLAILFISAHL